MDDTGDTTPRRDETPADHDVKVARGVWEALIEACLAAEDRYNRAVRAANLERTDLAVGLVGVLTLLG